MPADTDQPDSHWSFQPLKPVPLPTISGTLTERTRSPIDAFILARLHARGLTLSMPANRRQLLRRASLVITGLPPRPVETSRLLTDTQPGAWERAVDRLLSSPRYGERWAGHWLDVVRFAETTGYESNTKIANAWYYRDYVIRALNDDTPYTQFVFEQLAGDTVNADAATGFLVAGPRDTVDSPDERLTRQQRQDKLDEIITATGSTFLGLTVGCARCHSHKFDPIPQRDYYALQAVFAGVRYGNRRLRGLEDDRWQAQLPAARKTLTGLSRQRDTRQRVLHLRPAIDTRETTETFEAVTTRSIRLEIHATLDNGPPRLDDLEAWTPNGERKPGLNVALLERGATARSSSFALENQSRLAENLIDGDRKLNFFWKARQAGPAWVLVELPRAETIDRIVLKGMGSGVPADYDIQVPEGRAGWRSIAHSRNRMLHPRDNRHIDSIQLEGVATKDVKLLKSLVAQLATAEREVRRLTAGPQAFIGNFVKPATTFRLRRGDPMQRLEQVFPDAPRLLGSLKLARDATDTARRTALARRLVAPGTPLTARVIVNRVWQHHFGTGLVDTPSDLGRNGSRPTHPKLLNWLAFDLVQHGWSLKHLHRCILLSATFGQSSRPRKTALAVDNQTRLLWRFPPRRLEAEALRDSILLASGKLNSAMFGPGFDFYNIPDNKFGDYVPRETFDSAGWRRMIYGTRIRLQRPGIFGAFDCPDAGQMAPRRSRSTTPVQSLGLFNSRFVNRHAEFLAERAQTMASIPLQVDLLVQQTLGRPATTDEHRLLGPLATEHGLSQAARVLMNSSEFVFLD